MHYTGARLPQVRAGAARNALVGGGGPLQPAARRRWHAILHAVPMGGGELGHARGQAEHGDLLGRLRRRDARLAQHHPPRRLVRRGCGAAT